MLDFLTGQKRNGLHHSATAEMQQVEKTAPLKDTRQQLVNNFIKKNTFQGKSVVQYSIKCLSQLAKDKEISQGAFFLADEKDGRRVIRFISGFASPDPSEMKDILELGEGFPGQVARDGRMMVLSDIPAGYFTIESGLGKAAPVSLILFPVKHQDNVLAVIELASFQKFSEDDEHYFYQISDSIAQQILKCKNS
jgi:GAF domain-containing protein